MTESLTADPIDRNRFPVDPWALRELRYDSRDLGVTETLFAVGNGYLGLRGNVEEGRDAYAHGTFINGFHEVWPIHHAEDAYGFATVGQTIVNAPDAKTMRLYVDDEPLLLSVAELETYERNLSFRDGVLTREIVWRTPAGKRVQAALAPDGVVRRAPPRGDGLRDHDAGSRGPGDGELRDPQQAGRRGRVPRGLAGDGTRLGSAPSREPHGAGAAAALEVGGRRPCGAVVRRHVLRDDPGRRGGPLDRDR